MATRYILVHYGDGEPYMETVTENETPFEGTPTYVRAEEYEALEAGLHQIATSLSNESDRWGDPWGHYDRLQDIASDLLAKHGGVNTSRTDRETVEKGCQNDPKNDPENQNIGKDGGQEVEAVAWRYSFDEGVTWNHGGEKPGKHRFGGPDIVEPLYTRPQPASTALVEALTKALSGLMTAYAACNGEDHPAYVSARSALSSSQSTSRKGER